MYKLLSLVLLTCFLGFTNLLAQPKLEIIGGDSYNWGDVKPSESPLKTKIQLKNVGNENLLIKNVKPSCGCTASKVDKDILKPGEIATVDISFNITSPGPNTKTVNIETNDSKSPNRSYRLTANLIKNIEIQPTPYFTFNDLQVGKEASSTVKIKNNGKTDIVISDFKSTPDDLRVNVSGKLVVKAGGSLDITAKITPSKAGYLNCKLDFKTTDADTPTVTISGYGNVQQSPLFNNAK